VTEPYPCYCPGGLAACDEPYVHCDRLREQRNRVRDALAEYFDENAPAGWSENTATALAPVIEQLGWEKAGEQLRLQAAELRDVADADPEQRKWNPRRIVQWLEDRAGLMDGGAR
jgi:hypothetical protein